MSSEGKCKKNELKKLWNPNRKEDAYLSVPTFTYHLQDMLHRLNFLVEVLVHITFEHLIPRCPSASQLPYINRNIRLTQHPPPFPSSLPSLIVPPPPP
jgi:hypothetical protein